MTEKSKLRVEIKKDMNDLLETLVKENDSNKSVEIRKAIHKHIENNIDKIEKQISIEKQKLEEYK